MKRLLHKLSEFRFRIKRIYQFIKIGWKDCDWDYDWLLQIEEQKLKWMYKYFSSSQLSPSNIGRASEIKTALSMLKIIRTEDSAIELINPDSPIGKGEFRQTKYVNTRNWTRFLSKDSETIKTNIDSKGSFGCICRDDLRIEKAWSIYCKMRQYFMRWWWD